MKKIVLILAVLALWQNWSKLEKWFGAEPAAETSQGEVILYATSWCGYCKKTRELLADQGVRYIEYDIETSEEGRRQYEALNGRAIPVLNVRGTIIYGYNEARILAALR